MSEDRRLNQPIPILRRCTVISAVEAEPPSLRWAIKNPAPNDPSAEHWGDTYFARHIAAALQDLGQEVVIDHRPAFDRPSGAFDDVVLVLRGLAPYRPQNGQINLGWLISHPEMLSRDEASAYDRLFAASAQWADETFRAWGIRVDPLLQATDPSLFNPDRARPDTGHPVLFVGSSRRKVRPIVRDAISVGMPVAIYGREWQGIIPDGYVKAEYLANDKVGAEYRAAGLVLNDHWEDMRTAGFLSNRLFDAVASGARVITDEVAGLGDIFGRSVQVARDEADLARFAALNDLDDVFGGDDERRSVAARVHAEHSFAVRAQTLLEAALDDPGRPPRRFRTTKCGQRARSAEGAKHLAHRRGRMARGALPARIRRPLGRVRRALQRSRLPETSRTAPLSIGAEPSTLSTPPPSPNVAPKVGSRLETRREFVFRTSHPGMSDPRDRAGTQLDPPEAGRV